MIALPIYTIINGNLSTLKRTQSFRQDNPSVHTGCPRHGNPANTEYISLASIPKSEACHRVAEPSLDIVCDQGPQIAIEKNPSGAAIRDAVVEYYFTTRKPVY